MSRTRKLLLSAGLVLALPFIMAPGRPGFSNPPGRPTICQILDFLVSLGVELPEAVLAHFGCG